MAMVICRICLENTDKVLNIFDDEGFQRNIKDIITQHFWFRIEENDVESKQICMICWEKIENFHVFYTHVYETHNSLNQDHLLFVETAVIKTEIDERGLIEHNVFENIEENTGQNDFIKTECKDILSIKSEDSYSSDECSSDNDDEEFLPPSKRNTTAIIESDGDDGYSDEKTLCPKSKGKSVKNPTTKKKLTRNLASKSNPENVVKRKMNMPPRKSDEEFEAENVKMRENISMACELCDTKFSIFADATSHYRTVHKIPGYLMCCGQKLTKRLYVMNHIQWHLNPLKCPFCQKLFKEKRLLNYHVDNLHHPEKRTFKCDHCEKSFLKSYALAQHKKYAHEQRETIECKECNKKFVHSLSYQLHMRNMHGSNTYVCEICAQMLKNKTNYEYHMKTRHPPTDVPPVNTKMQCEICGAWLKTKCSYQKHLKLIHCDTGEKYICNVCGKECPTQCALLSHKNYHKLTRKYKCEFCDKAYKMKYLLAEHMTTHTGEVLYSCPFCPRQLNSSANLYAHKKKKHPVEWAESKKQ